MTKKIPTVETNKNEYTNYWQKAQELHEAMEHGLEVRKIGTPPL